VREARDFSIATLYRHTNDWNQFSLFEFIAATYLPSHHAECNFPDFTKVGIYRSTGIEKKPAVIPINLDEVFNANDCAKNLWLEWGDVVEIPERDHAAMEHWPGLSTNIMQALNQCLRRTITVVVKGRTNQVTWVPFTAIPTSGLPGGTVLDKNPVGYEIWLTHLLKRRPSFVMTSSDLSRVKVTRLDPQTRKRMEYVIDARQQVSPREDLWLRDGDLIEIPEKQ
jgi:hypothetical protein